MCGWQSWRILGLDMDISQMNTQHRCIEILNLKKYKLYDCKIECYEKHNENGLCLSCGTIGKYVCTCVYNCTLY